MHAMHRHRMTAKSTGRNSGDGLSLQSSVRIIICIPPAPHAALIINVSSSTCHGFRALPVRHSVTRSTSRGRPQDRRSGVDRVSLADQRPGDSRGAEPGYLHRPPAGSCRLRRSNLSSSAAAMLTVSASHRGACANCVASATIDQSKDPSSPLPSRTSFCKDVNAFRGVACNQPCFAHGTC